jgi:hypothetical protein
MIAGSDTLNGAASSLTDASGRSASRITSARRVGSASAAKVRSSAAVESLTMWLSIAGASVLSSGIVRAAKRPCLSSSAKARALQK